ncbi:MAG: SAM-dependent methyltransferase, partial [Rhodobacteraceae bacterium]|nr:SAM-dependent methyltransferase [Paracoccaceae bacterium]
MTINELGATAFLIAGIRALEGSRDAPLFSDPYASLFVDAEWQARTQALLNVHFAVGDAIRLRTIALNRMVEAEIAQGTRQIVTLGSGFDMRHAIFKAEGVRFFEVEQPAVLDFKAEVLGKAGVPMCTAVACDYLEDGLPGRLCQVGLDPEAQTLFVWEGNTMYLPVERLFEFLGRLSGQMKRFRVGFDYLLKSVLDGTYEDPEAVSVVRGLQKAMGVDWVTGFDSLERFETDVPFNVIKSAPVLENTFDDSGSNVSDVLPSASDLSDTFAGIYRLALIE